MARAAVAAGADGLIIEVHYDPDHALSDGAQSMFPAQFDRLMAELRIIAPAIGREHLSRAGRAPGLGACNRSPASFARASPSGIVGLGLIGGSVALAAPPGVWPRRPVVVGVDRGAALDAALLVHGVDVARRRRWASCVGRGLVVLAAPVRQNIALLGRQLAAVAAISRALVTDTGSTKRAIVEAARHAAGSSDVRRRPSARRRRPRRPAFARADLFAGPALALHAPDAPRVA